ncbi:hypothetical protein [Lignipirellula cremea]|uniref:Uncharacterized protein n=1 Tax=Lignipirellula cremea TaxID=2528010 RepID=A0A518E3X9_9BACT|nr:hypothetical protein [Lignipirellula cremea]QDU98806.1 hypothetical protein Pla8534_67170 [Lignipirellula cremea]
MRFVHFSVLVCVALGSVPATATEPDAQTLVDQVVRAAGGEDKLLKLFRIKEQLSVGSDPDKKGKPRVSVIEPPAYWWIGKKQRDEDEPARYLAWAWTLGAVTDPKSKLEVLPEITEADKPAFGLRVSGSITPPMDLYFDKSDGRLLSIDWKSSVHRLSDWKEHDGVKYPAKCIGYKKKSNKPWYFSEILELERLEELPEGLAR